MTVAAITMVKNEADVIDDTIRHMLGEVGDDGIVLVADNLSTDNTRRILDRIAAEDPRLVVDEDPDPAYEQSAKMSHLARVAAERGATIIIPFDADEVWYSEAGRVGDVLRLLPDEPWVITATIFNHFATSVDPVDGAPFRRMRWRKTEPGALPKVAFRYEPGAVIHMGNHGVSLPSQVRPSTTVHLALRHFPARSAEQFTRKGVQGGEALALTGMSADTGAHWRGYKLLHDRGTAEAGGNPAGGDQILAAVFYEHFWYSAPWESGMVEDPAPLRRWESTE